tara:strand:- start:782 stop:1006 length:225 start_codon:yes stop_codon:yes gene_type:complete
MSFDLERLGWGCYWSGREKDKQITELVSIIQKLKGESELKIWKKNIIQRAEEKEIRRLKRELNKVKKKTNSNIK